MNGRQINIIVSFMEPYAFRGGDTGHLVTTALTTGVVEKTGLTRPTYEQSNLTGFVKQNFLKLPPYPLHRPSYHI